MNVLTGKEALLSVKVSGTWCPALCATECAYYFDHEEILISSRNSGKYVERMSRFMSWGFNLSGLTKADDTDGQKGFFYFAQASVRGQLIEARIRYTDDAGNIQDISGEVLVKAGTLSSTVGGFSVANINLPGSGEPSLGTTTSGSPTTLYKKYLSTTEGAFEVSHADLGGITNLLMVEREDGGYTVISSGSPSGRQVKYTDLTTSGKFTFDSSIPFNPGEIVYALYEKA